jgi:HSP20 family molecular chaperone IbpA
MNDTCNTNEILATPAVYMAERPEGYDITFEIPGAGKGDVNLHVDGRTLRLRTTKKPAEKPAGFREAIREFDPDRNYAVTVDLPELADPSTAKASVENGVLRVNVAKRPENQPRRIEIG